MFPVPAEEVQITPQFRLRKGCAWRSKCAQRGKPRRPLQETPTVKARVQPVVENAFQSGVHSSLH